MTWDDISAYLDLYESDDQQRLTGIRKFCKWLTASDRIGIDPSAEQPEDRLHASRLPQAPLRR